MNKIALIWGNHYNDKLAHTHHTFYEISLKDMGIQFDRFSWTDWQTHMRPEYDLYFFIDFNPILYQLHKYPQFHPRCFYFWDSFHFPLTYVAQVTEMFDRSYFAELITSQGLQNLGYTTVHWLPPAFYPGIYRPIPEIEKNLDFSFIGQPDSVVTRKGKTRKDFFEELSNKYPKSIVEQSVYGDDVNKIYNHSRILIDKTIWGNIGTRIFEIIGSGGFALINKCKFQNGIDKLAIDNVHYVSYDDSWSDCVSKIDYYLEHEDERKKIAQAGHKHFLANHTYKHRLEQIFKDFGL